MNWQLSRRGMSQIWLQVRQQSRNISESCFVLATSTNSFSQYDDFWLSFLKYGKLCSFFPKEHFVHFTGEILLTLSPQCKILPKKNHCSQTCGANQLKKAWFTYLLCSANSARCSWSSSGISLNSSENCLHQIAQDDEDRDSRIYKWHETPEKHTQNNIIKGNKNSIQDSTNECTVLQCCYRENKQH